MDKMNYALNQTNRSKLTNTILYIEHVPYSIHENKHKFRRNIQTTNGKSRHNEYIKYLQEIVGDNDEFYAEGGRFDEIRKNTPQMIEEELQAEKDMKHRHKMNQTAF